MTVAEVFAVLETMRNETMVAHNKKNGAGDNQFGASWEIYAHLPAK